MSAAHDPALQDRYPLQPLTPDRARAARLRARCHQRLVRREQWRRCGLTHRTLTTPVLASALTGALCLLYAATLLGNTLRLVGAL